MRFLARTHFIVLTDSDVYHHFAATAKDSVSFIPWDNERKDLLVKSQHEIFKAYKLNPHAHELPPVLFRVVTGASSTSLKRREYPSRLHHLPVQGWIVDEVPYLCLNIHAFHVKLDS